MLTDEQIITFNCIYSNHTSLEATLRKIKLFKQSANAGVSKKPIQKFWDMPQLFWMGDFGDSPKNLTFFKLFGAPKLIFGVQKYK